MDPKAYKRVLVIDDSPVYRRLITGHLREWGFEVTVAENGAEGWKILEQANSPNLVLLDWVMPGMDGVELCRKVRARRSFDLGVYMILVTSKENPADLLKAMEAGVDDYLVKPFDEQELKARLQVGQRIVALQRELIEARESMHHATTYDGLTGLLNRQEIVEFLRRELVRSAREKKPVSIILADIDLFKMVNDQLGPVAGDEVVKEVGRRLRSKLRAYDGVGRYGGEEFLLVLPGCDLTAALIRADQVRSFVSSKPVETSGAKSRTVTVSMGVAVSSRETETELHLLLNQADTGLFKAKRNGRNRVEQVDEAWDKTLTRA
jgi:two-component system, cell cycle response regulator